MQIHTRAARQEEKLIKVPITADLLHGVVELEQTARGLRPSWESG
ncbi:hypothetical protein [Microlunatus elymi]|nr:hypothetical protein [Microlunatus elymi]